MIPLTIILLAAAQLQRDAERIDQRIRQPQYVEAVEARERYRQDVLAQRIPRPASHLSLAEEAASRKAEIDRWLITPEALRAKR